MDSLLTQDYPHVEILVRDDGSSDSTINLLEEYASNYTNIKVVFGENLGFIRSFFKLLELASPTVDYLALCDQDDVWREDKISRAVSFLSECSSEFPALYCTRFAAVDDNLDLLSYSEVPRKGVSFCNALVECVAYGCTSVLNQAVRRLLLCEFPQQAYSHDWWFYLVVSAFGHVIYDEEPTIFYRRHASNVTAFPVGEVDTWRVKIQRFLKSGKAQLVMKQAEEFRRIYGSSLSDEHREVLKRFLESRKGIWNRLRYALSCEVYPQSRRDNLILKGLLVLNRL